MNILDNASSFSILQISDLHIFPRSEQTLLGINTEHYFKEILQHAYQQGIAFDLLLVTGDLAQDPCIESYQRIEQILSTYNTPTLCLAGNHDDWELMQRVLNQGQISCARQRLFQHWQLINLNSQKIGSNKGWLEESELQFLASCLRDYPTHHALIAVHHHCYPTFSTWLDTMLIGNREQLFEILADFPQLKIITTGHLHQYLDVVQHSIRILGTPSTCFQFKAHSEDFALDLVSPGYRILNLAADGSLETQVFRLPVELRELDTECGGY